MRKVHCMRDRLKRAFSFALEKNSFSKTSIVKQANEICVYGLGKYFEDAFIRQDIRERFGVTHLCDASPERRDAVCRDARYSGLVCISPEDIGALSNPAIIFMLGDPRQPMAGIREHLPRENWNRLIAYNDLILDDVMQAEHECLQGGDIYEMLEAFDLLSDEQSREVFCNVLCLRIAPQFATREYEDICTLPQYFPKDIVHLTDHELVLDCGAYIGDTLQKFAGITGNAFSKYHAFEMDADNYAELKRNAAAIDTERIFCHNCGVWDENTVLHYGKMSSADSYSVFNSYETERAKMVRLDDFLKEERKISFIKMDIEGAEMRALHGAERIIREQEPKLAICAYHRIRDLWQIPLYIHRLREDYRLYMRHHAKFWVSETVCYGV